LKLQIEMKDTKMNAEEVLELSLEIESFMCLHLRWAAHLGPSRRVVI